LLAVGRLVPVVDFVVLVRPVVPALGPALLGFDEVDRPLLPTLEPLLLCDDAESPLPESA